MMPAFLPILVSLVLEGVTASPALPAPGVPASLQRVAGRFDFEESTRLRLEMPLGFKRVTPMGVDSFTSFGTMRPDDEQSHDGRFSFRFDLDGHSMAARSTAGLLPIRTGTEYEVSGWIRTENLVTARASMAAWLVDGEGRPLPGTVIESRSIESRGAWTRVSLFVPDHDHEGHDLVLECRVLQQVDRGATLDDETREDISGTTWFDDLAITQVPTVRIDDGTDTGIHRRPDAPRLRLRIDDPTTEPIAWTLSIADTEGVVVDRHEGTMQLNQLDTWVEPILPANGWYTARLTARTTGTDSITRSDQVNLVLLPARTPTAPVATIGLELATPPHDDELALIRELGVGLLSIPALTGTGTGVLEDEAHRRRLGRYLDQGGRIACRIDRLPPSWSRQHALDEHQVAEYLLLEEATWGPVVDRSLLPFGDSASRWLIAVDETRTDPQVSGPAQALLLQRLKTLAPEASVDPLQDAAATTPRQLLQAWRVGAHRYITPPWTTDDRGRVRPTKFYPVLHTLLHHLSGRTFDGELGLGTDAWAWYLAPMDGEGTVAPGLLVMPGANAVVPVALGTTPIKLHDTSGNHRLIPLRDGTHDLAFHEGRMQFVEHIDDAMVRFHRDLQLDPPRVIARPRRHPHTLEVSNPWPTTLEATLQFHEQPRLQVDPNRIPMVLAPGETKRVAVEVLVTGPLAPGVHFISGSLVRSGAEFLEFPVSCRVDVGLPRIDLVFTEIVTAKGVRVIMQATSRDTAPRSIEAVIAGDGLPTTAPRRFDLAAGATIVHHFNLVGTPTSYAKHAVYVQVAEVDATGRISHAVHFPDDDSEHQVTEVPTSP